MAVITRCLADGLYVCMTIRQCDHAYASYVLMIPPMQFMQVVQVGCGAVLPILMRCK